MVWGHYLGLVVFLLDYVCAELLQLCLTLCYPVDYRPRDFSVHGILQARILKWVAILFSKGIFPTQGSNPHALHWKPKS